MVVFPVFGGPPPPRAFREFSVGGVTVWGLPDCRQHLVVHPVPELLCRRLLRGGDQAVEAGFVDDLHLLGSARGVG